MCSTGRLSKNEYARHSKFDQLLKFFKLVFFIGKKVLKCSIMSQLPTQVMLCVLIFCMSDMTYSFSIASVIQLTYSDFIYDFWFECVQIKPGRENRQWRANFLCKVSCDPLANWPRTSILVEIHEYFVYLP